MLNSMSLKRTGEEGGDGWAAGDVVDDGDDVTLGSEPVHADNAMAAATTTSAGSRRWRLVRT
jgi:hypothetical protein